MQHRLGCIFFFFGITVHGFSVTTYLRQNSTCQKRRSANPFSSNELYGKGSCPCVGVDNLLGYYATQQDAYHVQYNNEAGASCNTWEMGMHPECRGGYYDGPDFCRQSWCYVDPCNCDLDVLPKMTNAGIKYQGGPAYWSYATCGSVDTYTDTMNTDSCAAQKTSAACAAVDDCLWNGKVCGGKEVIESCAHVAKKDPAVYGEEDCRCIGIDGRQPGKAFMYIDEERYAQYSPNVGAYCDAWEMESHPECAGATKPAWCSLRWCFVDPCKCKTKTAPKMVSGPNRAMRFQGKVAHWSAETCGSSDSSPSDATMLGKDMEQICETQEKTGVIQSGAFVLKPFPALLLVLLTITAAFSR